MLKYINSILTQFYYAKRFGSVMVHASSNTSEVMIEIFLLPFKVAKMPPNFFEIKQMLENAVLHYDVKSYSHMNQSRQYQEVFHKN
jgi:alpha-ketoglutarate-dependent taurine dioxygenase